VTLTVVAFDPGLSPSAAVYRGDDTFVLLQPAGVEREITRRRKNEDGIMKAKKGITHTPDTVTILALCRDWLPDIYVVEKVNAMPGRNTDGSTRVQGTASIFGLGHSAGLLEGIGHGISLNGITQVRTIRPQEWRGAWSMPEGKEQSRLVASRIFPSRAADFKLVKSHNVADPLLMAVLVWHRETGTPLPLGRI
jgi:hypothetical protein